MPYRRHLTDEEVPSDCQTTSTTPSSTHSDTLCPDCAARVSQLRRPLVSPLEHLLSETSRHLPSAAEEIQIRHIIDEASTRVSEIDATSARINLILKELAAERKIIQEYADKHRVMVAPVWELPPEILSYIFVLCLPSRAPLDIKRHSIRRSLSMTRINRHWRNVALGTPQLWTTIFIDSAAMGDMDGFCMPKIILDRSGACPLSICITSGHSQEILDFILPLSERWERIIFDTPLTMLQGLAPVQNRLLLLRTLEIKSIRWLDDPDHNHLTFFSNAPRLRHLSVSSPFTANFRVLPFKQLLTFDGPVMLHEFPKIFEHAPKLEECFLQPVRMPIGQSIPEINADATHNLTHLYISTGLFANMTLQLQQLPPFPNLRKLFLYYDKRVLVSNPDGFLVPLFAASGSQLEHLTFGISVSAPTLRRCLSFTPAVKTLQIHRGTNDLMLTLLSYPEDDDPTLIPKLEILRLSGKVYFKAETVVRLIRARWQDPEDPANTTQNIEDSSAPKNLKEVYILPPRTDKFEPEARKELLKFNGRGLIVQLKPFDRTGFLSHTLFNSSMSR